MRFRIYGLSCAEEVTGLKREVGSVIAVKPNNRAFTGSFFLIPEAGGQETVSERLSILQRFSR